MTSDENIDAGANAKAKKTTSTTTKKKLGQPSASEDSASPYPSMELAQQIHKLTVKAFHGEPDGDEDGSNLQTKVLTRIREELENPSLYEYVESSLGVTTGIWSIEDIAAKKESNIKMVQSLEEKVDDAKESAGDMEVMDARIEIARFAAKSLTEDEALEAYKKLLNLPKISSGKKIDAVMESSRVSSFYGDSKNASESIDKVSTTRTVYRPTVVTNRIEYMQTIIIKYYILIILSLWRHSTFIVRRRHSNNNLFFVFNSGQ
jgi:hypothetical protein